MKLLQTLAQKRAQRRREVFWRNFRAARRCQRGFYLIVVGYVPSYQLAYTRRPLWRLIGWLEHHWPFDLWEVNHAA